MNALVTPCRPHADPRSQPGALRSGWAAGHRLCFLHIPKTAGTALGAALAQRFALHEIAPTLRRALTTGAADPLLGMVAPGYRLLGVGSHLDQDKLDAIACGLPPGERMFTVTVLREPRARLISQYRHWRRTVDASLAGLSEEHRQGLMAARDLSLGAFLGAGIPFVVTHFRNMQARMICGLATSELMDDAALRDAALASLACFDVVGGDEPVDAVMARIAEAYGWTPPDCVRPLNVAPGEPPPLDPATEALIEDFTRIDRVLWDAVHDGVPPAPRVRPMRYHRPDPAFVATLLEGRATRFTMAQALDGEGWHVREGEGATLARWTGPARRAALRLRTPQLRRVDLAIRLVSVLDWTMVDKLALHLDGVPPLGPPQVRHAQGHPVLHARFEMPDAGTGRRELSLEVPFTRSHRDIDPSNEDGRQKGLAIGTIEVRAAQEAEAPRTLGDLFWPDDSWSGAPPGMLCDLVTIPLAEAVPPTGPRDLAFDLPLLRGILDLMAPDHVWAASRTAHLRSLERGTPLDWPVPPGRLAVVVALSEIAGRGNAIARLAGRFEHAVLLLPCAEDHRLREVAANPLLAPWLHMVGCTNGILVVNLAGLRRAGGAPRVAQLLLLLERIATTQPEALTLLRSDFGPNYALLQLDATLRGLSALQGGSADTRDLLATLMLEPASPVPATEALRARGLRIAAAQDGMLSLAEPSLVQRLRLTLDKLVAEPEGPAIWQAALSAQDCAFRLSALLAGWHRHGLVENVTGQLALRLRAGAATSAPLHPRPARPRAEHIDVRKAKVRTTTARAQAPDSIARLDTVGGGPDRVSRLNQAAREVELALRLLGQRFPTEEILWIDVGCACGVIMNAVKPPAGIRDRCAFLGFDSDASGIHVARRVAADLGLAQCRFEVGDLSDARALATGRRIHLITAFAVLEHCPDPLALLSDCRAMDPGMLVVDASLCEAPTILPDERQVWAFSADGFTALVEAAGLAVIGLTQRHAGRHVGGQAWVTAVATTADPRTMTLV